MKRLLVVGSVNADLVMRVPRFPGPGETLVADSFATFPGGKGANQAAAAAVRGVLTAFCGAVGQDSLGDFLAAELLRRGVQLDHLARLEAPTGTALILVNAEGENQIVIASGANGRLMPGHVEKALKEVDPAYVMVQLEVSEAAVAAALGPGRRVILNPAPFRPLEADLLARTFLITPNETEFRQLTGSDPGDPIQLEQGADWLHAQGVPHVCVTLGSRGAWWSDGNERRSFAAPVVQPVDTTGAGDAFSGVLAAELARGSSLESAISLAVAAASYSTTRPGTMASYLSEEELSARLS